MELLRRAELDDKFNMAHWCELPTFMSSSHVVMLLLTFPVPLFPQQRWSVPARLKQEGERQMEILGCTSRGGLSRISHTCTTAQKYREKKEGESQRGHSRASSARIGHVGVLVLASFPAVATEKHFRPHLEIPNVISER